MKKLDLGQTITIIANLGVLAGLLLLAYELNQNREIARAQTRHEVSQSVVDQFFAIALDSELSSILQLGHAGELESSADQTRYQSWMLARARFMEDVHYQYRTGLYDEEEFAAQKRAWTGFLAREPFREWWAGVKDAYSPEFVREIDETISNLPRSE